MNRSLEERLQHSLDEAEDRNNERQRVASEKARMAMDAAEIAATQKYDYENRYDQFDKVLRDLQKVMDERPDGEYRLTVGGRPNPAPHIRSNAVTFLKKATARSYSFNMHVDQTGVFQIQSPDMDPFSSGIMNISREDFQNMVFTRFDAFAQSE